MTIGINPDLVALGALSPKAMRIDDRTLVDRLAFAARYTELIIYFNSKNKAASTWAPFFLKDPVILLASISKTNYRNIHEQVLRIEKALQTNPIGDTLTDQQSDLLNTMFDICMGLFAEINDWLNKTELGSKSYPLRLFINQSIQTELAPRLRQTMTLQRISHRLSDGICPAPDDLVKSFNSMWDEYANAKSFGAALPTNVAQIFPSLKLIYQQVFGTFVQVIDNAVESFDRFWDGLQKNRDGYADTSLLIAFTKLMDIQRDQLNGLTEKHLDFYYRDILHNRRKKAISDQATLCFDLKPGSLPLYLQEGTQFDAGTNSDQQPQTFSNATGQWLNTIKIEQTQSLRYDGQALYVETIADPATLVQNPDGSMKGWRLLGDKSASVAQQGLSIASPLLALASGTRIITLTVELDQYQQSWADIFIGSKLYLSTADGWISVQPLAGQDEGVIVLSLDPTIAPIAPLKKNPDGYASQWPLLKWMFGPNTDLTDPPILKDMALSVTVCGIKDAVLQNDLETIDPAKPFMPLGPTPLKGANFYIGSAEVFSKPITGLDIFCTWDELPEQFETYYQGYNQYLDGVFQTFSTGTLPVVSKPYNATAFEATASIYHQKLWQDLSVVATIESEAKHTNTAPTPCTVSDFSASTIDPVPFNIFGEKPAPQPKPKPKPEGFWQWLLWQAGKLWGVTKKGAKFSLMALQKILVFFVNLLDFNCPPQPSAADKKRAPQTVRYQVQDIPKTVFTADPAIQSAPLTFAAGKKEGFMRFTLATPDPGFGSEIYPKVLTAITLANAYRMTSKLKITKLASPDPIPEPSQPLIPKASEFSLNYSAGGTNLLTANASSYPLELYHYDSFATYQVFNGGWLSPAPIVQSPSVIPRQRALFPGTGAGGCTYFALTNIVLPFTLTLFFNLKDLSPGSASFGPLGSEDPRDHLISFWYLSAKGWRTLEVLSDETSNFQNSGIIEVSLPSDMALEPSTLPFHAPQSKMTGERGWIALTGDVPSDAVAKVIYLNTQAVTVSRDLPQTVGQAGVSHLKPNTIKALKIPNPDIATVMQPFASEGGRASETKAGFYKRVSARMRNKDRGATNRSIIQLAYQALPSLFYCYMIPRASGQNLMRLVVVNGVDTPTDSQALHPTVYENDLKKVAAYLSSRLSPMIQLEVINPDYEPVQVTAKLEFHANVPTNLICKDIQEQLKIYLSPWIKSSIKQRDITKALSESDILDFINSWTGVKSVKSICMSLSPDQDTGTATSDEPKYLQPTKQTAILSSSDAHSIKPFVTTKVAA